MFKRLFSMSGFKLGVLLTLLFCGVKLFWVGRGRIGAEEGSLGGFLENLENSFTDLKFLVRGGPKSKEEKENFQKNAHVVIAAIDEKSLRMPDLGLWPWPRAKTAMLVEQLLRCKAKVVGFDAVFAEPDNLRIMPVLTQISQQYEQLGETEEQFSGYLSDLKKKLDGDASLVKVLEDSENVVLGYFFYDEEEEIQGLDQGEVIDRGGESIGFGTISFVKVAEGVDLSTQILVAPGVRANLPSLTDAVEHYGFFNVSPDRDRIYRRTPLVRALAASAESQEVQQAGRYKLFPALSLKMLAVYFDELAIEKSGGNRDGVLRHAVNLFVGVDPDTMVEIPGHTAITLGNLEQPFEKHIHVPVDWSTRFRANYYGRQRTFRHVSAGDIIHGEPEACAAVRGKLVVVGATSVGVYDLRPTPFEHSFPGVEIHATIIENIIRKDFLLRDIELGLYELTFMLVVGLLFSWLLTRFRLTLSMFALLVLSFTLLAVDVKWLFPSGILVYQLLQQAHLFVLFLSIAVYRYATEEREKAKIRNAFQFYLSGDVIDTVLQDTSKLKLGGERRELTVLFSDIRGFTTISEGLTPEALTELLNEYLTPMTELVFKYRGTLDKYMGDAIMAIFGAPVPFEDHARAACRCALEMMAELKKMQAGWRERGLPEIDIGIGLNTGPMSVGNMGSARRFDYTVMGDHVNLGSRLEGSNKQYGTHVIVSEYTRAAIGDHFTCRELDLVAVKGKKEPVRIFELVHSGPSHETEDAWINRFEEGLAHYRKCEWDQAVAVFTSLVEERQDPTSTIYLERCEHMRQSPPEEGWDGVFRMTTK